MVTSKRCLFACVSSILILMLLSSAVPKHASASDEKSPAEMLEGQNGVRVEVLRRFPLTPGEWYEKRTVKDYSRRKLKFLMVSVNSVTKMIVSEDDIAEFDCSTASRPCNVAFTLTSKHELIYTPQSEFTVLANIVAFYE